MTAAQKHDHDIACRIDEEHERQVAHDKRRAEYEAGIKEVVGYIPDGSTPIDIAQHFLSRRISDLDKGEIGQYDFIGWESVIFICAFNMEYYYTGVTENGVDEVTGNQLLTVYGASEYLKEYAEQQALLKLLASYFTAGAALAKRIGSATYQEWRDILIIINFEVMKRTPVGEMDTRVKELEEPIKRLNRQLWADNEIYKRNQMISLSQPSNTQKEAKNNKSR